MTDCVKYTLKKKHNNISSKEHEEFPLMKNSNFWIGISISLADDSFLSSMGQICGPYYSKKENVQVNRAFSFTSSR